MLENALGIIDQANRIRLSVNSTHFEYKAWTWKDSLQARFPPIISYNLQSSFWSNFLVYGVDVI